MLFYTFLAIVGVVLYTVAASKPIELYCSEVAKLLQNGAIMDDPRIHEVDLLSNIARSVLAHSISELVTDIQSISSYQNSNIKEDYDYHTTAMRIRYKLRGFGMVTRQEILVIQKLLNSLTKILDHPNAEAISQEVINGAIKHLLDWEGEEYAQSLTEIQIRGSVDKMAKYKKELICSRDGVPNGPFINFLSSGELPRMISKISDLIEINENKDRIHFETEFYCKLAKFRNNSPSYRAAFPGGKELVECTMPILKRLHIFLVDYLANFNTHEFQTALRDVRDLRHRPDYYYRRFKDTTTDHETIIGLLKGRISEIISSETFKALGIQFAFITLLIRLYHNNEGFEQIEMLVTRKSSNHLAKSLEKVDYLLFSIRNALETGSFSCCKGLESEFNILLEKYSIIKFNSEGYNGLEEILCDIQGKIKEISAELSKTYKGLESTFLTPYLMGKYFSWSFLKELNSNLEAISTMDDNDPNLATIWSWARSHIIEYDAVMRGISSEPLLMCLEGPGSRANALVKLERFRDHIVSFDSTRERSFRERGLKFINDFYIIPEILKISRFAKETISGDINIIKQLIQWEKGHDYCHWFVVQGLFDNISTELGYFKKFPGVELDDFQAALYDLSQKILPLLTKEDKNASDWDSLGDLLQKSLVVLIAWKG